VRVYFNNHVQGKAFRNAGDLEEMLTDRGAPPAKVESPQKRLF